MTKAQERARARRRYEKVQAKQARKAADAARFRRVLAVLGVVAVVAAGLAVLGLKLSKVDPAPAVNAAGCQAPPTSLGTGAQLTRPDKASAEGKTFTAVLTTNCGDITMELDGTKAPQAVASFVQLANENYWLNAPCHRVVRSTAMTVLQCGDPTGTGQGGPGYGFGVENPPADGTYERGTVAMARTSDPQQGNGGQFFIVDAKTSLPDPNGYTVFGKVVAGLDIVDRNGAEGVAGGNGATDGAPAAPISILRVAVTEKKA